MKKQEYKRLVFELREALGKSDMQRICAEGRFDTLAARYNTLKLYYEALSGKKWDAYAYHPFPPQTKNEQVDTPNVQPLFQLKKISSFNKRSKNGKAH